MAKGDLLYHLQLRIEIGVKVARFSIEDMEVQCQRHCPMPTAPARAYAMKACEDQDALEVIVGIFSLDDIEMHALIDLGYTHSYV